MRAVGLKRGTGNIGFVGMFELGQHDREESAASACPGPYSRGSVFVESAIISSDLGSEATQKL